MKRQAVKHMRVYSHILLKGEVKIKEAEIDVAAWLVNNVCRGSCLNKAIKFKSRERESEKSVAQDFSVNQYFYGPEIKLSSELRWN